MTTKFTQQVPYTFLLRLAPDNSYFILCPREISVASNKCLNFYGYGSFVDYNSIMPHYMPPTPVDFGQFGAAWCNESLTAYLNAIGLKSYKKEFHYEGVVYQANGNNLSAAGINNALLVGRLEINNQIDTDFDNLFSDLISQIASSAVSIVTQLADTNTNLLSVILNLTNISSGLGNIKSSLDNLNIDIGDVDIQTDNLVTQLQNIYTILSSQNSNQAAIRSAITNKDNQSDIVNKLSNIFEYQIGKQDSISKDSLLSIFKIVATSNSGQNSNNVIYSNFTMLFHKLIQVFIKNVHRFSDSYDNVVYRDTYLSDISSKLQNIETKLEQNLPFTTLAQVDVVTDYTQVVKGVGKNE